MPFMNFQTVNAKKNLKMEFKKMRKYDPSFHWDFNRWPARRDIKEALLKGQSNKKIADSRESYEITDTCSPDFNFWRVNSATPQFYLLTHELKHKFNYLQAV